MLPPVWVERAGSESARLGRPRPLSDLVDMPIDTVYMSMDMSCRATLKLCSEATTYLLSSLFYSLASCNRPPTFHRSSVSLPNLPHSIFIVTADSSPTFSILISRLGQCVFFHPTPTILLLQKTLLVAISVGRWIRASGTGNMVDGWRAVVVTTVVRRVCDVRESAGV